MRVDLPLRSYVIGNHGANDSGIPRVSGNVLRRIGNIADGRIGKEVEPLDSGFHR